MTDKKKPAQDVQEAIPEFEQLDLFDSQTPEEQARAILDEIAATLAQVEQIRSSTEYKANDLLLRLEEIAVLAERCSSPGAIKTVCKSAAQIAADLYRSTDNKAFEDIANRLTAVAAIGVIAQAEAKKDPVSIVYTATGKEFTLPDELEAYREDNPAGAEMYEQEREAEPPEVSPEPDAVFRIDTMTGYTPKLDPNSPEFDVALWRETIMAVDENGETMAERLQRSVGDKLSNIVSSVKNATAQPQEFQTALGKLTQLVTENLQGTMRSTFAAIHGLADFLQSEAYTAIKESMQKIGEFAAEHAEELQAFADVSEEVQDLLPFLQAELEEHPELRNYALADIIQQGFDEQGNPIDSPFRQAIARAKQRKSDYDAAQQLAVTAERLEEELPILRSIVPTRHTMPNNALINELQKKPAINAPEHDLTVANTKGRRKEITATVKVSYDEAATGVALTGANMTEYERQVSDAVVTLWLYGDDSHIMTSDMIYRTMTGQTDVKAPPGQKGAITKFMKKWEGVRVTIDCSEEAQMRKITDPNGKPIRQMLFDEYYINTRRVQVKAGKDTTIAWQILSKPVILTYCEMTNQLLTVPAKMLDIKAVTTGGNASDISLSNNDNRIAAKGNLLRQIQIMKGKKHNKQEWSNIISFATVFSEIGIAEADKNAKKKVRDYIFLCLDYWKAEHFITDYTQRKDKNTITGVQIIL